MTSSSSSWRRRLTPPISTWLRAGFRLAMDALTACVQIEGVYPVKPATPAVGGNEGVAVVEHKGRAVKSFNRGDWVIPARPGLGWIPYHA